MKHLGNCDPDDFMAQAIKLRAPLAAWIEKVGAPGIRKRARDGYDKLTSEEKARVNNVYLGELIFEGLNAAPELSRECLCIATFVEPDHFADHNMMEYIEAAFEMYGNATLRSFFTFIVAPLLGTSSEE